MPHNDDDYDDDDDFDDDDFDDDNYDDDFSHFIPFVPWVSRISRNSITGSDMPSALGLVGSHIPPELCAFWQKWNPSEKGGKVAKGPGQEAARPSTHWGSPGSAFPWCVFVFTFSHPLSTDIVRKQSRSDN